jgi:hypothetical protein
VGIGAQKLDTIASHPARPREDAQQPDMIAAIPLRSFSMLQRRSNTAISCKGRPARSHADLVCCIALLSGATSGARCWGDAKPFDRGHSAPVQQETKGQHCSECHPPDESCCPVGRRGATDQTEHARHEQSDGQASNGCGDDSTTPQRFESHNCERHDTEQADPTKRTEAYFSDEVVDPISMIICGKEQLRKATRYPAGHCRGVPYDNRSSRQTEGVFEKPGVLHLRVRLLKRPDNTALRQYGATGSRS